MTGVRTGQTFHRCSEQDGWRVGKGRERQVGPGARGDRHRWSRWREVGGSWVAAEYGVIGEISRGSSTAADARKRRLSSRCPPFSISFSFSSPPPSLSLCFSLDLFSVIQLSRTFNAASLFLSNSYSPSLALPFFAVFSVLWIYVNVIVSLMCCLGQH